ncbi:hypothetical protein [Halorussus salinus]|uniref:hypothetical protein n=1 Tax=Halorussus salinus TaxID=1364935 RepID=UPI001092C5C6|nr:hypothetical protein [Halorussus salinus]
MLEAQRETLADMDTKAVRTVRITVILLGVLLSAWRIEAAVLDPVFASVGGIALVGALAAGTFTYSESDLYLGPNQTYVERLADRQYDGDDWERDLLCNFGGWIDENAAEIQFNSRLLSVTQTLFVVGVVAVGASVVL